MHAVAHGGQLNPEHTMRARKLTTALCMAVAAGAAVISARLLSPALADQQPAAQQPDMGDMLVKGLLDTPGCLAANIAQWDSGKTSVVGWFESKQAVIAWYDSGLHRRLMQPMGGGSPEPLAHIPDDQGPIMVMATITPSARPEIEGFPAPISQVSIELFAPLPGGAHLNGRLAPDTFPVEHMRDLNNP